MFGMDVDARDILEGLKGRDTEGGGEGWSYQKQKDSLEAFNMDILICDNVVGDPIGLFSTSDDFSSWLFPEPSPVPGRNFRKVPPWHFSTGAVPCIYGHRCSS